MWHHRPATISRRGLVIGALGAATAASLAPVRAAAAAGAAAPVRVSDDGFDLHVEPDLAANPRRAGNLLAACTVQHGDARGLAGYASFDGGRTWRGTGLLPGSTLEYDGDVTVGFDRHGGGFVLGVLSAAKDLAGSRVQLWRTDDGGRTFTAFPPVRTGTVDHTWLATGDPHRLHLVWVDGPGLVNGLAYAQATAGGAVTPPRFLDPHGRVPMIAAGPGGGVHIIYQVFTATGWRVMVVSSTDHGDTFTDPVTLAQVTPPDLPPTGLTVNTRSTPTIAVAGDGTVHAAHPSYQPATARFTVELARSTDHGRTWTTGTLVAAAGTLHLQPRVAVDGRGRIAVTALAATGGQVRPVQLVPGRPPRPLTPRPFDATLAPGGYLGDHQALAAGDHAFHALWNDTSTGSLQLFTTPLPPLR